MLVLCVIDCVCSVMSADKLMNFRFIRPEKVFTFCNNTVIADDQF